MTAHFYSYSYMVAGYVVASAVRKILRCVHYFFVQNEYTNRRMSDPSSSWNYFQHGSLKRTGVRKSRSGLENVETIDNPGCNEVEAGNFEDGINLSFFAFYFLVRSATVSTCRPTHNLFPAKVENGKNPSSVLFSGLNLPQFAK